ncbi:hypothetical protein LguiB_029852 [Lonicera macranthoides]
MPESRQAKRNGGISGISNPTVDNNIEEAIRRLRIQSNDKQDGGGALGQYSPYPDRPGEPDCIYYLRTGMCGYGSNCRFNHPSYFGQQVGQFGGEFPERIGQPDCGYFLKTGTCKYGSTCKYHHPRDRHGAGPVLLNILGLPIRQDEKSCSYYMRTGTCKYGVACKFDHPQPSSTGTVLPVPGPAAYGSTGLAIVPSSDLAYTGGLPAWSLARATYFSGPRSQGTQTYMPLVFSPSQGIAPAQSWNTYVCSIPASEHVLTSFIAVDCKVNNTQNSQDVRIDMNSPRLRAEALSDTASSILGGPSDGPAWHRHLQLLDDQGSMSPAASTNLLGESGGINGQVHSLSQSVSNNLPERPDQPECRYFMNTGSCKYGSDCKYHHPREKTAQFAASALGPLGLPLRPGQAVCSYYNMYGLCKYGPTCKFDHPVLGYSYNYSVSLPALSVLDSPTFPYHQKSSPTAHFSEISPSKSSKFTEWNNRKRGGAASKKNPKIEAKTPEDSPEQASSPKDSLAASEHLNDQSE